MILQNVGQSTQPIHGRHSHHLLRNCHLPCKFSTNTIFSAHKIFDQSRICIMISPHSSKFFPRTTTRYKIFSKERFLVGHPEEAKDTKPDILPIVAAVLDASLVKMGSREFSGDRAVPVLKKLGDRSSLKKEPRNFPKKHSRLPRWAGAGRTQSTFGGEDVATFGKLLVDYSESWVLMDGEWGLDETISEVLLEGLRSAVDLNAMDAGGLAFYFACCIIWSGWIQCIAAPTYSSSRLHHDACSQREQCTTVPLQCCACACSHST